MWGNERTHTQQKQSNGLQVGIQGDNRVPLTGGPKGEDSLLKKERNTHGVGWGKRGG